MKELNRIAIVGGLFLALGVSSFAQQAPPAAGAPGAGRQGGGRAPVSLATAPIKVIDSFLKLTDDEKTKITKIQEDYKTEATAAAGDRTAITAARTKATEGIDAILTADQKTKWTEIAPSVTLLVQSRTVTIGTLVDLKLTADQWTKIKAAAKDTGEKIKALPDADRRTGRAPLIAEFKTAAEAVLTVDQKAIIEKAKAAAAAKAPAAP